MPELDLVRLVDFRRDLHQHPELKYEERRTSEKISTYLGSLGIDVTRGFGVTGLVACIHGQHRSARDPGPIIGIRADIDALPLQEINEFAHSSVVAGQMHACGHDGHTAMVLGAAELLARQRDFDGTVCLIFQPAEEGGAGARAMMDDGLFDRFPCQAIFALHNWPALPQGQMAVRRGPMMAGATKFEILVQGQGGHAALPHTTVDPIPIACSIVGQMQTLISRVIDPLDAAVLTVGKIDAGTSPNIIPDRARIYGTCRTLKQETETYLLSRLHQLAIHIAQAHQANAELIILPGSYPNTTNHDQEAIFMAEVMREIVGTEHAFTELPPAMTSEDFGFMLEEIPGAYGWIGNGPLGQSGVGLHNPGYDFNDDNLALGARFWDLLARRWLATQHVQ